jgi:hypothetical protein
MKLLALVLLCTAAFAAEASKPSCNKPRLGQFWPDAANRDPGLARVLAQSGDLEVCSLANTRYRWRPLTVNVAALKRRGKAAGRAR